MATFEELLRRRRAHRGWTQAEVARTFGVSTTAGARWESGLFDHITADEERIVLDVGGCRLELDHQGKARLTDGAGGTLTLDTGQVTIEPATSITVSANADVAVSGSKIDLDAASATATCETLQANHVMSNSYTPGAGNIW